MSCGFYHTAPPLQHLPPLTASTMRNECHDSGSSGYQLSPVPGLQRRPPLVVREGRSLLDRCVELLLCHSANIGGRPGGWSAVVNSTLSMTSVRHQCGIIIILTQLACLCQWWRPLCAGAVGRACQGCQKKCQTVDKRATGSRDYHAQTCRAGALAVALAPVDVEVHAMQTTQLLVLGARIKPPV